MNVQDQLQNIIAPVLDGMGIELVELRFSRGKYSRLRVYVWEKDGISIGRCSEASRRISDALDQQDVIAGKYTLEVSSPGLDRPLKTIRDFQRHKGDKVKVTWQANDEQEKAKARIIEASENAVDFETKGRPFTLNIDRIISAKIIIEI